MHFKSTSCITFVLVVLGGLGRAVAVQVPFVEDFSAGTAGWLNTSNAALTQFTSGGPDGGSYVSTSTAFSEAPPEIAAVTVFRAEEDYLASGGAFLGDWPGDDAGLLSAYIRHHAPVPLTTFVRFATQFNFPGATIGDPTPVPPDVWTQIRFQVDQTNPRLTIEGPYPFTDVFGDVGNLQIGVEVPASESGNTMPYGYDLALVRIGVPEPSGLVVVLGMVVILSLACGRSKGNR